MRERVCRYNSPDFDYSKWYFFQRFISETDGTRYQYRTVPYHLVSRRYGIGKKRSRARRYGTVLLSRGTVRYAVLEGYTALPRNIYNDNLEQNVLYTLISMSEV